MGKKERDKGMRFEREVAKELGGYRVPLSGAAGGEYTGDVKALGLTFECKVRKDGFKQIYQWIENTDALAIKADGKPILAVIPLHTLMKLLKIDMIPKDGLELIYRYMDVSTRLNDLEKLHATQFSPLDFGNRLSTIRKNRKKSLKSVAEFVEVSIDDVMDWESNVSRPTLEEMVLLARFLNTSVRYIELGLIEDGQSRKVREKETA